MNTSQLFKVRKAGIADLDFIHHAIVAINEVDIAKHEFELLLKAKLKTAGCFIFILEEHTRSATKAGLLVARSYQNLTDYWPIIEIQELYIIPKYRKLGGADFLYNYVEGFSREQKAYRLKVNCNINSTLNQNFYTTRGFKISKKQYAKDVY